MKQAARNTSKQNNLGGSCERLLLFALPSRITRKTSFCHGNKSKTTMKERGSVSVRVANVVTMHWAHPFRIFSFKFDRTAVAASKPTRSGSSNVIRMLRGEPKIDGWRMAIFDFEVTMKAPSNGPKNASPIKSMSNARKGNSSCSHQRLCAKKNLCVAKLTHDCASPRTSPSLHAHLQDCTTWGSNLQHRARCKGPAASCTMGGGKRAPRNTSTL